MTFCNERGKIIHQKMPFSECLPKVFSVCLETLANKAVVGKVVTPKMTVKIWPCSGSSGCTWGAGLLTHPVQLSRCMSGCVAHCSTVTVDQPAHGQTDLAWVHTVRGHGTAVLLVVSAHWRSLRQLSPLMTHLCVRDRSNYRHWPWIEWRETLLTVTKLLFSSFIISPTWMFIHFSSFNLQENSY